MGEDANAPRPRVGDEMWMSMGMGVPTIAVWWAWLWVERVGRIPTCFSCIVFENVSSGTVVTVSCCCAFNFVP